MIPSLRSRLTGRRAARAAFRPGPIQRFVPVSVRLILGLAVLVALGTFLLSLPGMSTRPLGLSDILFTSVSAVTVTGLSVIVPSTDLTLLGQIVLLVLIQLGGVGFMFVIVLGMRVLGQRVSLIDRMALTTSLGLDRPAAILRILRDTLIAMLVVEGVGALLLYLYWTAAGIVPSGRTLFYAIFHAVSAFCNAGFDLFYGLPEYPNGIPNDPITLILLGLLVLVGGLGFPVISELVYRRRRKRLSLHARITLVTVLILTLVGMAGLLISEFRRGGVLEGYPLIQRTTQAWFQSVVTRTAGFAGLNAFTEMSAESRLLIMGLMFIGGAPASMGGGITTGTFAVLVLAFVSVARGLERVQAGDRTLSRMLTRRAVAVLLISLGLILAASWLILLTHDLAFDTVLFEVISAFATCGLSLGITGALNPFGRLIIMVVMFWGRLGALTIAIALLRRERAQPGVQYPEEPVLVG